VFAARSLSATAALVAALVAAFAIASCGPPPPTGASGGPVAGPAPSSAAGTDPLVNPRSMFEPFPFEHPDRVADDEVLIRYVLGEPRSLNPIFAVFWEDLYLSTALFEAVVTRDVRMRPIWNRTLVEEGELATDLRSARVRLRDGLRWQDGEPFTAADVRFTWEAILDPSVPAASYKHTAAKIEDLEVVDDRTLRCRFHNADVTNLGALSFPVIPRHIWDVPVERAKDPTLRASEYFNHYGREEIVGSGPYRFVESVPRDRVVVERWDGQPDPAQRPAFRRIVFRAQPDRNLALLLFKKGELDDYLLTPQQFATQTGDEEFRRVGVKGWGPVGRWGRICWNMDGSNPFFTDPRVRRALAHAYDMDRVIRDVTYGVYQPSAGIFGPGSFGYDPAAGRLPFDLDRARALLEETGWSVSAEDGWRYREIDGRPVRFSFELSLPQTFADGVKMADIYREDLRRIGVEMTTVVRENAAHEERLAHREQQAHADATEVTGDPDTWAVFLASKSYRQGRNYGGYSNPQVDDLFERGRRELDSEKREAIYREIHRLTYADQPYLMLWQYAELRALSKRIRGVELAPSGAFLFQPSPPPGSDWWTSPGWWVPREDALRSAAPLPESQRAERRRRRAQRLSAMNASIDGASQRVQPGPTALVTSVAPRKPKK
jgi:peptide/nickel transport system substrate-binding protein